MKSALARHDELMRQSIEAHGGDVFTTAGDAFAAAPQCAAASESPLTSGTIGVL